MPEPQDDVSIRDEERLLRRIRPGDIYFDTVSNQFRPQSNCFRSTTDIISVHIASLTSPEAVLSEYPAFSLIEITAGELRSFHCILVRDPLENDVAHALVFGEAPGGRMSKGQAKTIVKHCRWVCLKQ